MPVEKYRQIPKTCETILWDGTNTDELIALMGDSFKGQGVNGIEFKLKEPNHYGNDWLLLTVGMRFTRFSDGYVTNGDIDFQNDKLDNWELIKD